MKIISKETTNQEKSKTVKPIPQPSKRVEPPVKKASSEIAKPVKVAKRAKKEVPVQSRPNKVVSEPTSNSYFHDAYNRFVSLLRFNITFKLSLGYTMRLVTLIAFLFIFVYISFAYFLFYQAQTELTNHSKVVGELFKVSDKIGRASCRERV